MSAGRKRAEELVRRLSEYSAYTNPEITDRTSTVQRPGHAYDFGPRDRRDTYQPPAPVGHYDPLTGAALFGIGIGQQGRVAQARRRGNTTAETPIAGRRRSSSNTATVQKRDRSNTATQQGRSRSNTGIEGRRVRSNTGPRQTRGRSNTDTEDRRGRSRSRSPERRPSCLQRVRTALSLRRSSSVRDNRRGTGTDQEDAPRPGARQRLQRLLGSLANATANSVVRDRNAEARTAHGFQRVMSSLADMTANSVVRDREAEARLLRRHPDQPQSVPQETVSQDIVRSDIFNDPEYDQGARALRQRIERYGTHNYRVSAFRRTSDDHIVFILNPGARSTRPIMRCTVEHLLASIRNGSSWPLGQQTPDQWLADVFLRSVRDFRYLPRGINDLNSINFEVEQRVDPLSRSTRRTLAVPPDLATIASSLSGRSEDGRVIQPTLLSVIGDVVQPDDSPPNSPPRPSPSSSGRKRKAPADPSSDFVEWKMQRRS